MLTRLSSRLTLLYTVVFPPLWTGMFGFGTAMIWMEHLEFPQPALVRWFFLAGWVLGSTLVVWFARRLSNVWIDGDELLVIRWRYEERIPLSAVEDVSETRMWNPKQIRVRIRAGAASRERIVFIAPMAFQLPMTEHRAARELREAARAHR
ncbi:MAG TPA: hypothetical protein VE913_20010 [Longimicrobium sp.]|nr:hypothetical protein [Longimicrobium sp.]